MNQRIRMDETELEIDQMCDRLGWKHESKEDGYYIETPEGKWKLLTYVHPLKVMHMPKDSDQYHQQHRTFLSMTDTVEYIRWHDCDPGKRENAVELMIRDAHNSYLEKRLEHGGVAFG